MKIIKTDNFCRDNVADSLVADNITNELYGKVMLEALNAKFSGEHSSDYYKLVADDYKLLEIDY